MTLTRPVVSPSARLAVGGERKHPSLVLHAFRFRLLLGLAHPGDFRAGVDTEGMVLKSVRFLAGNALGHDHPLLLGLVREHRAAHTSPIAQTLGRLVGSRRPPRRSR